MSSYLDSSDVTFISIHNRRTDYESVMPGYKFIEIDYFNKTIELYREKYKVNIVCG
jgi:hypothetical protein